MHQKRDSKFKKIRRPNVEYVLRNNPVKGSILKEVEILKKPECQNMPCDGIPSKRKLYIIVIDQVNQNYEKPQGGHVC